MSSSYPKTINKSSIFPFLKTNLLIKYLIRGIKGSLLLIFLVLVFAVACNYWVEHVTANQVFDQEADLPINEVGLVLGTSKYTSNGYSNPYFDNRIKAAVDLYKAGKIKHILVSGDNRLKEYNEPRQMLKALLQEGIPESAITMDFAGFRTLDSIVRCREVFGQQKITIISQKFHNQRALFLANHRKLEAVGYNAQDVPLAWSLKVRFREYLARCKAILDLITNKQPKFLGKQEPIIVKG